MPRNFDNVSKEVAQGADDVRKNLEGLIESAEGVDAAFAKMSERQKSALDIAEKFDKAMSSSTKAMSGLGHTSMSTARGLRAMDTVARSLAFTLSSIGSGAGTALTGLKSLASGASDVGLGFDDAERSVAGLAKGVSAMSKVKTKPMKPGKSITDTPVGSMMFESPSVSTRKSVSIGRKAGGKLASAYVQKVVQDIRKVTNQKKDQLNLIKDKINPGNRSTVIEVELEISNQNIIRSFIESLTDDEMKALYKARKKFGADGVGGALVKGDVAGIDSNKTASLNMDLKRGAEQIQKAYEHVGTYLSMLEEQARKESKTISDLYVKTFAQGGVEASRFAEGLAGSATGMMAVGLAGAYLSTKMSDVISQFMYAAKGLSSYQVETEALEHTISGLSKGSLEDMRQGLSMTRDQASEFFKVVKMGVSELGMSKQEIMSVAKALRETFGGDQTDRLREYVELLKDIPTLKADLSITASMDDQTSALFGLIEGGKMDVVLDMQSAGLLGGDQKQMEGASMLNANQKAANAMENVQDFLLKTLYPEWGAKFTSVVDVATKGLGATMAVVGIMGAIRMFQQGAHTESIGAIRAASMEIRNAISQLRGGSVGSSPSVLSTGKKTAGPSIMKGVGIGLATMAVSSALENLSESLEKGGDKAGAAVAGAGKSMASIAGMVAMGAMAGHVGMAVGLLAGVISEGDNLANSFVTLMSGTKQLSIQDQIRMSEQKKMVDSGKTLQDMFQKVEHELKSGKFELAEFKKSIAELKIGRMADFGGSSEAFNNAIDNLKNAVGTTYSEMMGVASKFRDEANRKDLTPELRKIAIEKANKIELDAAKRFSDEMDNIISQIFNNPNLKKDRLATQKAQKEYEIGVDSGTLSEADKVAKEKEILKGFSDQMDKVASGNVEAARTNLERVQRMRIDRAGIVGEVSGTAFSRGSDVQEKIKRATETRAELDAAKKELEKLPQGMSGSTGAMGVGVSDVPTNRSNLEKKISELTAKNNVEVSSANQAMGASKVATEIADVMRDIEKSNFDPSKIAKQLEVMTVKKSEVEKSISANKKESSGAVDVFERDTGALGELSAGIKSLEKMRDYSDGEIRLIQEQIDGQERINQLSEERLRFVDKARSDFGSEIQSKQKELKSLEKDSMISSLIGGGISERAKVEEERIKLYNEEYRGLMGGLDVIKMAKDAEKKKLKEENEKLENAKKSGAPEAVVKAIETTILVITGAIGRLDKQAADQKVEAGQAADKIAKIGEGLSEAFRAFDESLAGIRIKGLEDFSREIAESASYTGDVATASKESFRVAFKAVQERSRKEREIFEKNKKTQKDKISENIKNAKSDAERYADEKGMSGTDKAKYVKSKEDEARAESQATYEVWEKVEAAKIENKEKRGVVEAAKSERDLKEKEFTIQQSLVSESLSFVSEFGGSFSSIMELHKQDVDIERRRLDAVKEAFSKVAGYGKDSLEYQEAQKDVLVQEMNLRKKELGVQKSLMDRILGAAFGELNQSFGARRQFGSDQAMLGVGNTRMKTQGGMFVSGVPSGGTGTIEERSARRSTGSGWGGNQGASGGVLGRIQAAMKASPPKNKLEEANAIISQDTSGVPGSVGASGMSGEAGNIVSKALSAAKELTKKGFSGGSGTRSASGLRSGVGFENNDPRSNGGVKMQTKSMEGPTGWGGAWEKVGSMGNLSLSGGVGFKNNDPRSLGGRKMQTKSMERPTGWGLESTKLSDMGKIPLSSGVGFKNNGRPAISSISKSDLSSRAEKTSEVGAPKPSAFDRLFNEGPSGDKGASGEVGSAGESESKITGEITVKFDNAAFKDQVTKVVGSIISTPEIKKGIQQAAYA